MHKLKFCLLNLCAYFWNVSCFFLTNMVKLLPNLTLILKHYFLFFFFCSLAKNLGLFKGALKLILYLCDIPTPHLNSGMKCNGV